MGRSLHNVYGVAAIFQFELMSGPTDATAGGSAAGLNCALDCR